MVFTEVHPGVASGDGGPLGALDTLAASGWEWEQLEGAPATEHYACWPARRQ